MEFSLESLKQGGVAVLIATVMAAAALLLGKVLYNRFPYGEKSILQYGTLVTNSGFAGLPVVSGAYGDEGLFQMCIRDRWSIQPSTGFSPSSPLEFW